jgi:hypothetical protein
VQEADLAAAAASPTDLRLCIELPAFPHAVLYQQLPSLAAVVATGAKKDGGGSGSGGAAAGGGGGYAAAGGFGAGPDPEGGGSLDGLVVVDDSEVRAGRRAGCGRAGLPAAA